MMVVVSFVEGNVYSEYLVVGITLSSPLRGSELTGIINKPPQLIPLVAHGDILELKNIFNG